MAQTANCGNLERTNSFVLPERTKHVEKAKRRGSQSGRQKTHYWRGAILWMTIISEYLRHIDGLFWIINIYRSSSSCEESSIILSSSKSGNSSNSISTVDGRYDKLKRPQIISNLSSYKFSAVPKTEDDIDVLSLYDGVDSENDEFCTTSSSYDNNSISKSSCENIPTNNSTQSLPLRISRKPFSQSICLGKRHLQNLQKSFQSAGKPSPSSSTSLLNAVAQNAELGNKSSSVPILIQKCSSAEDCGAPVNTQHHHP